MFQHVNAKDLVVGEKYKMLNQNYLFDSKYLPITEYWYYTGKFHEHIATESQLFGKVVFHPNNTRRMDTPAHMIPKYRIFEYQLYYQFIPQKEKIQQAMEQRALDKILKRLVNDDFTW